jgi:hypothetical protein
VNLTKDAELDLLRSIATAPSGAIKHAPYVAGTALTPSVGVKPFGQVEINVVASWLGEAWVTGRQDEDLTQQWIWLVSNSDVPVIQIHDFYAAPEKFGANSVSVDDVLNRYFTNVEQQYQSTLDDITRAFRTWSRRRDSAKFALLFDKLQQYDVAERIMPLMMSALAESYVLRSAVPSRADFRSWLVRRTSEVFSPERSSRIFSRFF